jgi:hypothetical protein
MQVASVAPAAYHHLTLPPHQLVLALMLPAPLLMPLPPFR